jgi:hypothetical protein
MIIALGQNVKVMFFYKFPEMGAAVEDLDLFLFEAPAFVSVDETRVAAERAVGADGEIIFGKTVGDEELPLFLRDL